MDYDKEKQTTKILCELLEPIFSSRVPANDAEVFIVFGRDTAYTAVMTVGQNMIAVTETNGLEIMQKDEVKLGDKVLYPIQDRTIVISGSEIKVSYILNAEDIRLLRQMGDL